MGLIFNIKRSLDNGQYLRVVINSKLTYSR